MHRERAAELHAALGSEVRLRIVELVASHKEMCICELVDLLRLSQATISRHVSVLRQAKVLLARRVGSLTLLRVDEEALRSSFGSLLEHVHALHESSAAQDAEARLAGRCSIGRSA